MARSNYDAQALVAACAMADEWLKMTVEERVRVRQICGVFGDRVDDIEALTISNPLRKVRTGGR